MKNEKLIEELKIFVNMCYYARISGAVDNAKGKKGKGITKQDLLKKGVSEETFKWLVDNHLCNQPKKGQPLWIAVNGNKLYPTCTVQFLDKCLKEKEDKKEE